MINKSATFVYIADYFSGKFKIDVSRCTANDIYLNRKKIKNQAVENINSKKTVNLQFPQVEKELINWIEKIEIKGRILNDAVLMVKARKIAEENKILDFKCSSGWLIKLKKRNNYKLRRLHGETFKENDVDYTDFLNILKEKFNHYEESNIYNLDETGIFYKNISSKSICRQSRPGCKNFKDRFSVMLCSNYNGTDKFKPVVIGKSKKPRCFKSFKHENYIEYYCSNKAWMVSTIFNSFLQEFNFKCKKQNKKILLLMDNCPTHKITISLSNIEILMLPPNSTGHLQPMYLGIIHSFKAKFNQNKLSYIINEISEEKSVISLYKSLTLKGVILFIDEAWREVTPETITNCFSKNKNYEMQNNNISQEEKINNFDDFIKITKIFDPLTQEEFNDIIYTENDEILNEIIIEDSKNIIKNNEIIEINENCLYYTYQ